MTDMARGIDPMTRQERQKRTACEQISRDGKLYVDAHALHSATVLLSCVRMWSFSWLDEARSNNMTETADQIEEIQDLIGAFLVETYGGTK